MVLANFLNGKSSTITAAAVVIGGASLASRFLGVIRDRLLVGQFGVGDVLDAYYASFQLPNFVYNLLILGTLSAAFIPVFVEYWAKDTDRAWRITNSILNLTLIIMGLLSIGLLIFIRPLTALVAPGFSGEKFELTVELSRIMLISPLLFSLSSVFASVLNTTKRFLVVSLAPLFYNLSIIGGILIGSRWWGIYGVTAGVVIGAFLHMSIELIAVWHIGWRYRGGADTHDEAVRKIGRLFLPRVFGIDVSQVSLLIGTMIGSVLATGSVAIFNLAVNIQSVPIGVIAIPYALAAFPNLAEAISSRDQHKYAATISYTMRQILFFLIPIMLLTIVLRAHIVRLIIGTRQLSWDDTRLAAAELGIFAVSFVAQGLTPLFSRAFYALGDTVRPVIASGLGIIANVAVTVLAVRWFMSASPSVQGLEIFLRLQGVGDLRALSLAIGFVAASLLNLLVLAYWLKRRQAEVEYALVLWRSAKMLFAGSLAAAATYGTLQLMVPLVSTRTFLGVLGQLTVSSALGLVVYVIVSLLVKSQEMWQFLHSLQKRMIKIVGPVDLTGTEEL